MEFTQKHYLSKYSLTIHAYNIYVDTVVSSCYATQILNIFSIIS